MPVSTRSKATRSSSVSVVIPTRRRNVVVDSDSDNESNFTDNDSVLSDEESDDDTLSQTSEHVNVPKEVSTDFTNKYTSDVPNKETFNDIMEQEIQKAVDMIVSRLSYEMREGRYFGTFTYMELFNNPLWTFDNEVVREAFHRVEDIMTTRNLTYTFKVDHVTGFSWRVTFDTNVKRRAMIRKVLRGIALFVVATSSVVTMRYLSTKDSAADQ